MDTEKKAWWSAYDLEVSLASGSSEGLGHEVEEEAPGDHQRTRKKAAEKRAAKAERKAITEWAKNTDASPHEELGSMRGLCFRRGPK